MCPEDSNQGIEPRSVPLRSDAIRFAKLAAERGGYSFEILDSHSGYLCRIGYGGKSLLIGGGTISSWPINNATSATIANDKSFTAIVLQKNGISVPTGETVFLSSRFRALRAGGRELEDLPDIMNRLSWPVIAKPNNGSRGAFVQLCGDVSELQQHLVGMAERYDIGLLQRYISGEEYRVFVFDTSAVFSYRKCRAKIFGDGISTLEELVVTHNQKLMHAGLDPICLDSPFLCRAVRDQGFGLQDVPGRGTPFDVGARANLSAGGTPIDFTTTPPPELADLAVRAVTALGLSVAGVDIIVPDQLRGGIPTVLEVNSNPAISSLEGIGQLDLAVSIYLKVLRRMIPTSHELQAEGST